MLLLANLSTSELCGGSFKPPKLLGLPHRALDGANNLHCTSVNFPGEVSTGDTSLQ